MFLCNREIEESPFRPSWERIASFVFHYIWLFSWEGLIVISTPSARSYGHSDVTASWTLTNTKIWMHMQRELLCPHLTRTSYLFHVFIYIVLLCFLTKTLSIRKIFQALCLHVAAGTVKAFPLQFSIMCREQGPCAIPLPCLNKASLTDMGCFFPLSMTVQR